MTDPDLIRRYNYDEFTPEKFEPWMRFADSPVLGEPVTEEFALWQLEGRGVTSLREVLSAHRFTIVEFGSFT